MSGGSGSAFRAGIGVQSRRLGALVLTLILTIGAVSMFGTIAQSDGYDWLDVVRVSLIAISAFWLAWGTCTALLGVLFTPDTPASISGLPQGRTAILVPVYNESCGPVFARIEAMYRSLQAEPGGHAIDFHVLSDSTRADAVEAEKAAYRAALLKLEAGGCLYYRHRSPNVGRKAGNIADFVRTSGGAYAYMLVLDADSLMRGKTIMEMVRRMEAEPRLGLLQSLPQTIGLKTLFGRMLQYSSGIYAPTFTRGVAALQGDAGPFWGHNALIRVAAFAGSCGMAPLTGKPPFGGHILSHDTVEAALLARDGWIVRLDPGLEGSYEEAPPNMIEFAKRDRRWCQGNLQHAKILLAPRFSLWNRTNIIQGIFSYLSSPVWLFFLVSSLAAPLVAPPPVYFDGHSPFPVFPHPETTTALALLFGVGALLILPKLTLLVRAILRREAWRYGGTVRASISSFLELLVTSMLAPIHMMFQTRSVMQIVFGADSGWPAASRDDGTISFWESLSASWWMSVTGVSGLFFAHLFAPELWYWLLPVALPLVIAPVMIYVTASVWVGNLCHRLGLFLIPSDVEGDPVIEMMEAAEEGREIGTAAAPFTARGVA
ncbi:glucans biosynthesis glucosyltransferase MdoH [Roseibium litorale]|uniref:Glucans biosynthesis glucosyltransferase H n=1 Tax=Roseibium litorale TaxID=2803841 RepID=A0ABR9CH74_9HYPH|nr:glucans biosynthesis glucosyltransferase MdoH [Roseibium litorale]MBD8890064.1 glucans biosynthesis glucosyltransferase MdoH [Roseibium litorale]